MTSFKTMMKGKPQRLTSKFKISYNLLLNLVDIGETNCSQYAKRSMKKKKKRMLSIAGMCCCGFLAVATAISGSSAYQTDHDEVVNIIRTGNNTIIPDEDFPTPTPVPSSGSVVKKVRAKNTGDVPCYVRAYITCSEPVKEFTGLDTTNWVKGNDGYYYYKKAA